MSVLDGLLGWLDELNLQDVQAEARKLQAIREWALGSIGVDYGAGDKVVIRDGFTVSLERSPGWWPSRECLAPGALASVRKIDFSPWHKTWYAEIVLGLEWAVSELPGHSGCSAYLKRWWRGSAATTPEGYEPPSSYDQERHPDGHRHLFTLGVKWLRKATEGDTGLIPPPADPEPPKAPATCRACGRPR